MWYYRCYPALQVSQSFANLAPGEIGFSANVLLLLGVFLGFESQSRHLPFSSAEEFGCVGTIRYPKPRKYSYNDTGQPFNQKQQSPICDRHAVPSPGDQPCKTASKGSSERRGRDKQTRPEGQLLPLEKERE